MTDASAERGPAVRSASKKLETVTAGLTGCGWVCGGGDDCVGMGCPGDQPSEKYWALASPAIASRLGRSVCSFIVQDEDKSDEPLKRTCKTLFDDYVRVVYHYTGS